MSDVTDADASSTIRERKNTDGALIHTEKK